MEAGTGKPPDEEQSEDNQQLQRTLSMVAHYEEVQVILEVVGKVRASRDAAADKAAEGHHD